MGNIGRLLPAKAMEYFKKRSALCYMGSQFNSCAEYNCSACCTDELGREVTAFDIIAMALATGREPGSFMDKGGCVLKIDIFDSPGNIVPSLQLETPCSFLQDKRCIVHNSKPPGQHIGKPLICVTFPESTYAIWQKTGKNKYKPNPIEEKDYPCLKSEQKVTKERVKSITTLNMIFDIEQHISDRYLGMNPYDYRNILPDKASPSEKEARAFLDKIKEIYEKEFGRGTKFHALLEERLKQLNGRAGIEKLFSQL